MNQVLQIEPSIDDLRAQVRAVLDAHPDLHASGYGHPGDTEGASYVEFLTRQRAELISDHGVDHYYRASAFLEWCERLGCGDRKTTSVNSFALKHAGERFWAAHLGGFQPPSGDEPRNFIGNGAMIAAALHHGCRVDLTGYNPRIFISTRACHLAYYWYRQTFLDFADATLAFGADTLRQVRHDSAAFSDVKRAIRSVRRAVRAAPSRPREYTTSDTFAHVRGEVREARDEINQIIERVE